MAKKETSIDLSRYDRAKSGIIYYNVAKKGESPVWMEANKSQIRKYWRAQSETASGRSKSTALRSLDKKWGKLLPKGSFKARNGAVSQAFAPLAIKGGKNAEYLSRRAKYIGEGGKIFDDSSKRKWQAYKGRIGRKNLGKTNFGKGAMLNGGAEWIRQIQISSYQIMKNAESFRVAVGQRAVKVFQESIKFQKFWASGARRWRALAPYTIKKRAKRRTGSKILNEYGDLLNSIQFHEDESAVVTEKVPANPKKHKKHSICYAGYHNDPRPGDTYGNGFGKRKPKSYIRRQFMGHSDKIESFAFMAAKQYFFDYVFLIQSV